MNRKKEILRPLDELGLEKIENIEEALEKNFGQERAGEILETWELLSNEADSSDQPGNQTGLYEYLHSDPQLSLIVNGYTDGEILREVCTWIYDHLSFFGSHILDVGCGTGIVSCFLALQLPASEVTAVDRTESCIKTAEWVRSKMQAKNICFKNISAEDIKDQNFDTVLSVRTFHENLGIRSTDIRFLPFSEQVRTYRNIYRDYIKILSDLVPPEGRLICVERNRMDTEFYSVLQLFQLSGLSVLPGGLGELQCRESDLSEPSVFQAFILKRQKENCMMTEEDLFALWRLHAFSVSDDPDDFTRPQADWFTENNAGDLIEGYAAFDAAGTQLAKACLFRKKDDPNRFLMYQANYGRAGVKNLPMEALEEAQSVLSDHKLIDAARGFLVKEL